MRRLLNTKNMMMNVGARALNSKLNHVYISLLNIIQGDVDPTDCYKRFLSFYHYLSVSFS